MNTQSIHWPQGHAHTTAGSQAQEGHPASTLKQLSRLGLQAFSATVPALALFIGAAWIITEPELLRYLQALLWAGGFAFLGLAIDASKTSLGACLATGIALPALALLSASVAPEFAVLAAPLAAAWLVAAIFRRSTHGHE